MSIQFISLWVIVAYLFGSIPSGYLLMKGICKQDVREQGSGNIGATNVLRTGGKMLGLLTYVFDVLKIWIPMLAVYYMATPEQDVSVETQTLLLMMVGGAGVIGHMYSVWLRFNGGKGVASFTAYMLFLSPYSAVVGFITFGVLVFSTRIVSVASLCGVLAAAIHAVVYDAFPGVMQAESSLVTVANLLFFVIVLLIFWRHNSNIRRLIRGEERKLKL